MKNRSIIDILEERKILIDDLVKSGMELFVPHKELKNRKQASKIFREFLVKALEDVNVAALIMAGFRLEDDGNLDLLPGLDIGDFKKDAVNIIADEILGMAIAEYIGGTRARFEYVRYDMKKPGILKRLGPFADDVICGVIAGASSQMYTEAVK